jgi:hypothetical protein
MKAPLRAVVLLVALPNVALANGGGPLLLIVNGLAFLYGSVLIVLLEWAIYWWSAKVPASDAFLDALIVNLYSTVVVGLALPLGIGLVGALGALLPEPVGEFFWAFGTWIYEGVKYPKLTIAFTFLWLIVTYLLTVKYESHVLRVRWARRGLEPLISARAVSWRANSLTYAGLFAFLLFGVAFEFVS